LAYKFLFFKWGWFLIGVGGISLLVILGGAEIPTSLLC